MAVDGQPFTGARPLRRLAVASGALAQQELRPVAGGDAGPAGARGRAPPAGTVN